MDKERAKIVQEIVNYKTNGVTEEELKFTKSSMLLSDALRYESPNQKANFLNRIITYNLPKNYVDQQKQIIDAITKEEVNAIAKKMLHPERDKKQLQQFS